jgi:deoxyribodipyrimidine photolyase-related protein
MTLCGISTAEIHRWFTEMLIDSTDWALVPNLNLLKQFNRGPLLDQGVYLATSKFILDHSNFSKGEWCDIWDGLYWNFIEENKTELSKYTKTRTIVQRMTRLNKDKRRIINYRAQDFLAKFTI